MCYVCTEAMSMLMMAGNLKTHGKGELCDMMFVFSRMEILQLAAVIRRQRNWSPSLGTPLWNADIARLTLQLHFKERSGKSKLHKSKLFLLPRILLDMYGNQLTLLLSFQIFMNHLFLYYRQIISLFSGLHCKIIDVNWEAPLKLK